MNASNTATSVAKDNQKTAVVLVHNHPTAVFECDETCPVGKAKGKGPELYPLHHMPKRDHELLDFYGWTSHRKLRDSIKVVLDDYLEAIGPVDAAKVVGDSDELRGPAGTVYVRVLAAFVGHYAGKNAPPGTTDWDHVEVCASVVLRLLQGKAEKRGWSPKDDCSDFNRVARFFELEDLL